MAGTHSESWRKRIAHSRRQWDCGRQMKCRQRVHSYPTVSSVECYMPSNHAASWFCCCMAKCTGIISYRHLWPPVHSSNLHKLHGNTARQQPKRTVCNWKPKRFTNSSHHRLLCSIKSIQDCGNCIHRLGIGPDVVPLSVFVFSSFHYFFLSVLPLAICEVPKACYIFSIVPYHNFHQLE